MCHPEEDTHRLCIQKQYDMRVVGKLGKWLRGQ
jgi:hypothetical protein